jgi:hypothetical protein
MVIQDREPLLAVQAGVARPSGFQQRREPEIIVTIHSYIRHTRESARGPNSVMMFPG